MKWQKELEAAKKLAIAAGDLLKIHVEENKEILFEEKKDIKLKADKASEKLIIEQLQSDFSYPILSEEIGITKEIKAGEPYWIIDPLDGTFNYLNNIPLCAVSIALWKNSEPILGVINLFNFNELIYGISGQGIYLNDIKLEKKNDYKDLSKSVLMTGFPLHLNLDEENFKEFAYFSRKFKKVRMIGSAATSLAYVVAGRADVYWEKNIMLWDVAAGLALLHALGGMFRLEPGTVEWSYNVLAYQSCYGGIDDEIRI